jgi:hypothetical protein
MLLTAPDEGFNHQVALPHSVVGSSDPSWRERYWFSFEDTASRDVVVTMGLGQYPNTDTQEAFVVVGTPERQHNLRLARTLWPTPGVTQVGPFSVEVVEPFRSLRLVLEDNESGLACDITWEARLEPVLEDRHVWVRRGRVTYDAIRYVQHGRAAGWLRTPDREYRLTPATWYAQRDHSWGTRPLPRMGGEPPGQPPEWRFLVFCPVQFDSFGLHLYAYEAQPGRPVYLSGGLCSALGAGQPTDRVVTFDHDLGWAPGAAAPTLVGGTMALGFESGRRLELELVTHPGRAHLRGGGYEGVDGWFQGHWKGEQSLEHEMWDLTDQSRLYSYAKASGDHLLEVRAAGEVGYGVIEYMVLPGYPRYQEAIPARRSG